MKGILRGVYPERSEWAQNDMAQIVFINASLRAKTYKFKRRAPAGDGYAVPKEAASACDKSNSIHIGQCSRKALRIAIVENVLPVCELQGNSKRNDSAAVLDDASRL